MGLVDTTFNGVPLSSLRDNFDFPCPLNAPVLIQIGAAPEVAHFYVLLYMDRLMARPVEVWQVFVHALRKVDMRAMIGQTSQASVVVRGAVSRRVASFTSHPDELLVGGGSSRLTELAHGCYTDALHACGAVRAAAVSAKQVNHCWVPWRTQVSPDSFVLVGGALTELLLSFRPVAVGVKDIKVNIVDSETHELVYALLVSAEAQGPLITR